MTNACSRPVYWKSVMPSSTVQGSRAPGPPQNDRVVTIAQRTSDFSTNFRIRIVSTTLKWGDVFPTDNGLYTKNFR